MKKIVCLAFAMLLLASVSNAQLKFGVKAGANISSLSTSASAMIDQVKSATNYQFGVLAQAKAFGFAIQPEVLYSVKSSMFDNTTISDIIGGTSSNVEYKTQNVDVPVNLQFGLEFGPARVYLQAGPYVSFVLSTMLNGSADFDQNLKDNMNNFDYGVGAGAGVELFGLQLSFKYDWGLGKLGDATIPTGTNSDDIDNPFNDASNRNLSISLAYLF